MGTDHSVLPHGSAGWTALLPGMIPALLFVAVHGTRRSYEHLQAIALPYRESVALLVTNLDQNRDQLLLGLVAALVASSPVVLAIRHRIRVRRTHPSLPRHP